MTTPVVIENLNSWWAEPGIPVVLTVGTFDGVHLAHQALFREAVSRARAVGGKSAVLTFQNHPRSVVSSAKAPALIMDWETKRRLISQCGIDLLVGIRFDEMFSQIPAEAFIRDVIVGRFRAAVVLSGPAFHFGHKGAGNPAMLESHSAQYGYTYIRQEPVLLNGMKVSSTLVRESLLQGNVELAAKLLGRPHQNQGIVITGDRLGRTIGFPTANLDFHDSVIVPANGVYAVNVMRADGLTRPGMMNIGTRPTVNGVARRHEVHLIDFEGELVGERLRVAYAQRIRDEIKFPGLDALKDQLARDRETARAILAAKR